MAGSLSSPNLIKDVYTSLVFRKSDNKFYYYSGSDDVELLDLDKLDNFVEGSKLTYNSPALTSGNIFELDNNSTEVFSVDYAGVLKFKTQGSAPTAVTGGLYFDGTNIYLGQSS